MTSPQDPGQQGDASSQGGQQPPGSHEGPQQDRYQQHPQENPYAMPPVPEQDTAGAQLPESINRSFWLGIASVVVGFALLGASFIFLSDADLQPILREMAGRGQNINLTQARFIYTVAIAAVSIFTAILAALWITFLLFMRKGRRWARTIITIVGVLWVLLTLPSVTGGSAGGVATALLAVLQIVVVLGTLVFAHLKPSNDYFAAARFR